VAGALAGHAPLRNLVQLALHQRDQPIERGLVTPAPGQQEECGFRRILRNVAILGLPASRSSFCRDFPPLVTRRELMAIDVRRLAAAGIFLALTGGRPASGADASPAIAVHLDDYAHLHPSALRHAQEEVTRIYAAAGVSVVWVRANDPLGTSGITDLRVVILDKEMTKRKIASDQVAATVLGQALPAARRAYIFSTRVTQVADQHAQAPAIVLGRVIAHEIGHLLLENDGHADMGIMRSNLDMFTLVERFTAAQAAAIRRTLPTDLRAAR
jgi:hypothetical protein